MRAQALVLALVAATGTATYHSFNPRSLGDGKAPETPVTSAAGQETSAPGVARTLSAFDKRRTFLIQKAGSKTTLTASFLPDINVTGKGSSLAFDFVIAIVPDPEHSNLKLDFDRHIETIQTAAASEGYRFERFWFPWSTEKSASRPYYVGSGTERAPDTQRMFAVVLPDQHRVEEGLPGLLLFRNSLTGRKPLAVFLVSESPTAGIAANEFRNAVAFGRALSSLGHNPEDFDLRIIGPGLSGSLNSLRTLIELQLPSFRRVSIRTWASDATSHREFLSGLETISSRSEGCLHPKTPCVDFGLTDQQFSRGLDAFSIFLRDVWHDSTSIVLLTEEETAFGAGDWTVTTQTKSHILAGGQRLYVIPFPRNLSELRNATEKQDHLPGFGDDSRRLESPRNGLLFSLKQEANTSLDLPTYSKEQTPISQESVMFTIGGLLKTGNVHYAGIVATDPLDTLFLTRYLHSACPNLRVFTAHPDLLFEHGSDTSDYSGILAISRYPLVPLSQFWNGTQQRLYPFASEPSEAVHNAAVDILHGLPDNPRHDQAADLRDVANPFDTKPDPPLWITVAGRTGFQPIAALRDVHHELWFAHPDLNPQRRLVPHYWPGWGYLFSLLLVLSIAFCCLMLFARPNGRQALAMFSADPDLNIANYAPIPRAFFLFSMGLTLAVLDALWLVVPGALLIQNVAPDAAYEPEAAALGLAMAGALIVAGLEIHKSSLAEKQQLRLTGFASVESANRSGVAFMIFGPPFLWIPLMLRLNRVLPDGHTFTVLSTLFAVACFCIGGLLSAASIPSLKAVRAEIARKRLTRGEFTGHCMREPYIYGFLAVFFIAAILIAGAVVAIEARSPERFLAAYRSLDLTNGVSPLVPLSLLFAALIMTTLIHLRRMAYFEDRKPEIPDMNDDKFCPKLKEIGDQIKSRIQKFNFHPADYAAVVLLVFFVGLVLSGAAQTLEERPLEMLILLSAIAVAVLIMVVWIRVILIWLAFSEFLQQLERHPLRHVFSLLPRGSIWSPVWQGSGKTRTHVAITRSLECILALRDHGRTPRDLKERIEEELHSPSGNRLQENITNLLESSARRERLSLSIYREIEESLRRLAANVVVHLRSTKWRRGNYELRSELATKEETREALHIARPDYVKEEPNTICGEFVAYRFLAFINFTLWHIDNLVAYISLGFLLLVIALNSYAFRARTIIDWVLVLMFVVLTGGIVMVFAQADRDAMLSRITGTEEGKLDRHFFQHLFSYGAMPLIVLLATHFPTIGRFFFSWVKPAIEAIH